jgi:hypothetical protein
MIEKVLYSLVLVIIAFIGVALLKAALALVKLIETMTSYYTPVFEVTPAEEDKEEEELSEYKLNGKYYNDPDLSEKEIKSYIKKLEKEQKFEEAKFWKEELESRKTK